MVSKILSKLDNTSIGKKIKDMLKKELIKKIRTVFTYQILGALLAFASNVILARYLGVHTYGIYSFSTNLLKLLIIPTLLGFGTYTLRYYPRQIASEQWSLLNGYRLFSNWATIGVSVIIILISYVLIYFSDLVLPENKDAYMIFILSLPLFSFLNLYIARAQAKHKLNLALLPNYILLPSMLIILNLGVYYLFDKEISDTDFAWIYFGSNAFVVLFQIIGLHKSKIPEMRLAKPVYAAKEWLTTSLPMLFTSSLQLLLKTADIFIIGLLMTASDVGIYNAALKIDFIVLFGLRAANFVEAPLFSKLYGAGDMKGLQKMVKQSTWIIFVSTILISLPILFFGTHILSLFGKEFEAAYWPLIIILLSNAFNAFSGSVGVLMSMTNHQKEAFVITAWSSVLSVILNYFLISTYGIIGASIAIAITIVIRNVAMVIQVKKNLGINATVLPF